MVSFSFYLYLGEERIRWTNEPASIILNLVRLESSNLSWSIRNMHAWEWVQFVCVFLWDTLSGCSKKWISFEFQWEKKRRSRPTRIIFFPFFALLELPNSPFFSFFSIGHYAGIKSSIYLLFSTVWHFAVALFVTLTWHGSCFVGRGLLSIRGAPAAETFPIHQDGDTHFGQGKKVFTYHLCIAEHNVSTLREEQEIKRGKKDFVL